METAQLAVLAGFLGGAIGWIVRSLFDVFYQHYRERKQMKKIVRADLMSITLVSKTLRQKEFLVALGRAENVERGFLDRLFDLASIRSRNIDTKITAQFGPNLYKIEEKLLEEILSVYRQIITLRFLLDEIFTHFEAGRLEKAKALANTTLPLFTVVERKTESLCKRL